jgi:hypothetical protein
MTTTRRPDSLPARTERAVLEGVPIPSSRTALAASIRELNAALEQLSPDRQADLLPSWNASWDELSRQREQAPDEEIELHLIAAWSSHWQERLHLSTDNKEQQR